jgi:uncharacterized protein YndB with AHSA1/START domain
MSATAERIRPSLTLTRSFRQGPAQVYRAWTDSQALKQWFGPNAEFAVPLAETDVRVGGRFRIVMLAPDGEKHEVSGIYRVVQPNERLVFTWAWHSTPERESIVTLEFRAAPNGGTDFMLTHEHFFDEKARDSHRSGWSSILDRLVQFDG